MSAAAMHAAQGFGELSGGSIFQQIARYARIQCAAQKAGSGERGDDDHLAGQFVVALDALGQFQSRQTGHLDIRYQNVRSTSLQFAPGDLAICRFANYVDIGFQVEQGAQRSAHHGLVFGEDDADHAACIRCGGA